jgi:beta-xylosidase
MVLAFSGQRCLRPGGTLTPVKWIDDWPVIGADPNHDGRGQPVLSYRKPHVGKTYPPVMPPENDEFNSDNLGLQWQWHANSKIQWSALLKGGGYLRLFAFPQEKNAVNLWSAPNLLLQKLPAPDFTAATKVKYNVEWDVWQGKKAGLLIMGNDYAYVAISKDTNGYKVSMITCNQAMDGSKESLVSDQRINGSTVYLRVQVNAPDAKCKFSFSEDGVNFKTIGEPFIAQPDKWIGAKIGIFSVSTSEVRTGGYADFDWFRITP